MSQSTRHKIIFDTDPGVDDAMALLLALRSSEIEVAGVTTVFGNSRVDVTTRNALNILDLAGRTDIPVARGAGQPLEVPPGPTAEYVHGDDAMGNIGWTKVNNPAQHPINETAAQLIVDTVMAAPGEVTIVAVGPMTNLALALQLEPRIAQATREVVIMGGNVAALGNVSPFAEANIHNDPHAAAQMLSAGWHVTMAGLDVTQATQMDDDYFRGLAQSGDPFGVFVSRIVPFYQGFHRTWYGYERGAIDTHDPSAIAYVIDPTLFKGAYYSMQVPVDGPARGMTIADRRGMFYNTPKVHCLLHVESPRLLELFRQRITSDRTR
ncbi:MAG TPA: nucleoside hydrolase [Anaerolineae bacterium]